jgi:hypothetical protein
MVTKCANPDCSTEFKYFRHGRLYEFTLDGGAYNTPSEAPRKGGSRELFWLCHNCEQQLTLTCESGRVVAVPRRSQAA